MTILAVGSRHSMAYVQETTFGTTPATPVFKALRHNSTTLALTKQGFASAEIRADRQIANYRHGTYQVGGDIVSELSATSFDDLIAAAMMQTAWTSNALIIGTTQTSFTIERFFDDIGQYIRSTGCQIDGFSFSVKPNGLIDVTFPVVGLSETTASVAITGSTYGSLSTTSPMDGFTGIIKNGGTAIATVTQLDLKFTNKLAAQFAVGNQAAVGITEGTANVTGQIIAYFTDLSLLDLFINETESSLEFTFTDGTNSYDFLVPNLKYNGSNPDVKDDGPIMLTLPYQSILDTVTGTTLKITRTT